VGKDGKDLQEVDPGFGENTGSTRSPSRGKHGGSFTAARGEQSEKRRPKHLGLQKHRKRGKNSLSGRYPDERGTQKKNPVQKKRSAKS